MDDVLLLSLAVNKVSRNKGSIFCLNISRKQKGKGNCIDLLNEQVAAVWPGCGGSANWMWAEGESSQTLCLHGL